MNYGDEERRRWPRIPVSVRVKRVDKPEVDFLFTKDISVCGLGLDTDKSFEMGESIAMEISIEGIKGLIKVTGKIVRNIGAGSGGYGVNFTRFAPHSKSRLKEALNLLKEKK